MPIDFERERIHDPIHGSINLSEIETKVVNSASFQRLRKLKQLGLADYVFPGSTHSRFAHSIGALHIVSRMIDVVNKKHKKRFSKVLFGQTVKQKIRLAALLHDIGHLPLSHAMESPIRRMLREEKDEDFETETDVENATSFFGPLDHMANAELDDKFKHERFGAGLLMKRPDLKEALSGFNYRNEIGKTFAGDYPAF
ncbi:MAG: HD domain-containing protein, partial [bacterium]